MRKPQDMSKFMRSNTFTDSIAISSQIFIFIELGIVVYFASKPIVFSWICLSVIQQMFRSCKIIVIARSKMMIIPITVAA